VANWYTKPEGDDGIDVVRRYAVGDVYDKLGYNGTERYVTAIDARGQATQLAAQDSPAEVLAAMIDLYIALSSQYQTVNNSVSELENVAIGSEAFGYLESVVQLNCSLLQYFPTTVRTRCPQTFGFAHGTNAGRFKVAMYFTGAPSSQITQMSLSVVAGLEFLPMLWAASSAGHFYPLSIEAPINSDYFLLNAIVLRRVNI
jgi:hypothetical protein